MPAENNQEQSGVAVGELVVDYSAFAVAAGLAPDAGRTDIVSSIAAMKSKESEAKDARAEAATAKADLARILAVTGAASANEACGVITAWKDEAAEGKVATTKFAALEKSAERTEATTLIDAAVSDGRIVPVENRAKVEKIYADFGMNGLKAHLGALTPNPALAGKTPKQPAGNASPAADTALNEHDERAIRFSGMTREQYIEAKNSLPQSMQIASD